MFVSYEGVAIINDKSEIVKKALFHASDHNFMHKDSKELCIFKSY